MGGVNLALTYQCIPACSPCATGVVVEAGVAPRDLQQLLLAAS
jgi:hypothetical protein